MINCNMINYNDLCYSKRQLRGTMVAAKEPMKIVIQTSLLIGLVLVPIAYSRACFAQAPAGPAGEQHPPLPKPINLKVLPQDIESTELREIMVGFTEQLGVRCTFCHAENSETHKLNFADDSRAEKNTARIMMTMTKDLNAKYIAPISGNNRGVACGTCHRGHAQPAPFVPSDEHKPPPAAGN